MLFVKNARILLPSGALYPAIVNATVGILN